MDRQSYIGLGLIFLLLIGYFYINQPTADELSAQKRYSDSVQLVQKSESARKQAEKIRKQKEQDSLQSLLLQDTAALKNLHGSLAGHATGEAKKIELENNDIRVSFSNKGGSITQVELKNFVTDGRKPLLLMDEKESEHALYMTADGKPVNTGEYYWTVSSQDNQSIAFRLNFGDGAYIEQSYTLPQSGYNLQHRINSNGLAGRMGEENSMQLQYSNDVPLQERDVEEEKKKTTVYFKYPDESADYISEAKSEMLKMEQPVNWVSLKQQFFNICIYSEKPFAKNSVVTTREANRMENVKNLSAGLILPLERNREQDFSIRYFFGPNKYSILKDQGIGLDKIIPLGWGIFGWINRFMIIPIFTFLQKYLSNYGIIILLLTIIIKTLLLPLVFKSYKSTAKMKLLKPEMDEIKEKHKDDMQTIQMENLKLYKKAGVNPLGGCLPMLLQMPILIAVFQFVPSAFEFRQQSFLWADDLSIYDSVWNFGKLPVIDYIYGDHVSLFTLLMTISTLIYTKMNNDIAGGMNEQMKYISYLMPILFLGFFNKYAAALTYYYFLSNIITFTQQWAIRKFVNENKLRAQIHEAKSRNADDKKSAFQKRLEEMAKTKGVASNRQLNRKK